MSFIIFLVKAFLVGGVVFFMILALTNLFLIGIGYPIAKISKWFEFSYSIFTHFIFIYLYGFFGAFYYELVGYYQSTFNMKGWLLISISLIALWVWHTSAKKSLFHERSLLANEMDIQKSVKYRSITGEFNSELYRNLITMSGLRTSFFSIIAFVLFLLFPYLASILYGTVPLILVNIF